MSDLPARATEQYTDLLMFIYRDEVYDLGNPNKTTAEIMSLDIAMAQQGRSLWEP